MTGRIGSRGQALVEFAIVLPVLLLLFFALFDAGRAVLFYSELTNAARVGARVAMVNQSNGTSCDPLAERTFKCAASELSTGMGIAPGDVPNLSISGTDCALIGSCAATVTLSYDFVPVTPVISQIVGSINLTASSSMPIERSYSSP